MSAIATVLYGMGFLVEGSDLKESRYTILLGKEGINVFIGHERSNLKNVDAIVLSTAISPDNIELMAAKEKNIPIFTRGEVLAWILNEKKGIAVTGTHGKTTTTSMLSLIFRSLEMDPTIIVGGELNELGTNARYGEGDYIIAEACESDGTFLLYRPLISIITNIEEDHMDYWGDFSRLNNSFKKFISNTKEGGFAVINGDEIERSFAEDSTAQKVITFGINNSNDIFAENIVLSNYCVSYDLVINKNKKDSVKKNKVIIKNVRLNVPGVHNVKNSLAALAVCYGIGLDLPMCRDALQYFTGAKRRFEKRGEKKGALIFDDYAHHPTEVMTTLETAAIEKRKKIITVFQPHRYTRLASLHQRFSTSFDEADVLIITDVFASGEKPVPGVTGKLLIDSLIDSGFKNRIIYIPRLSDIKDYLDEIIEKDDIVLIMGAGDITRVTEELLKS